MLEEAELKLQEQAGAQKLVETGQLHIKNQTIRSATHISLRITPTICESKWHYCQGYLPLNDGIVVTNTDISKIKKVVRFIKSSAKSMKKSINTNVENMRLTLSFRAPGDTAAHSVITQ